MKKCMILVFFSVNKNSVGERQEGRAGCFSCYNTRTQEIWVQCPSLTQISSVT